MRCMTILLVGLLSISTAACVTNPTAPRMTLPPKPTLTIEPRPGGGMCLDRENTTRLGEYIQALEASFE